MAEAAAAAEEEAVDAQSEELDGGPEGQVGQGGMFHPKETIAEKAFPVHDREVSPSPFS